jgi:hypothetical protein
METHPDIKFIMLVDNPDVVERCMKTFLEQVRFKDGHEIYKVDIDIIKKLAFECMELSSDIHEKINLYKNKDAYVVFDDDVEYLDTDDNVIGHDKYYHKYLKYKSKYLRIQK